MISDVYKYEKPNGTIYEIEQAEIPNCFCNGQCSTCSNLNCGFKNTKILNNSFNFKHSRLI